MTHSCKTESRTIESSKNNDGKCRAYVPKKLIATAKDYIAAKVVLFSACQDHQKTAGIDNVRKLRLSFVPEGTKGGACTSLFLQVLFHDFKLRQEFDRCLSQNDLDENLENSTLVPKPSPMTYGKVLTHMQRVCERNNYTQVPLLSSSRPIQINKDPFQIVPDNFNNKSRNGTKRALIIGINYTNSVYELPGCHNDCRNVIAFLKQVHDFEDAHITLLLDDPITCDENHLPTKNNILRSFRNFAMQCQEGDVAFIHYAGHGVAVADQSGDEVDGFDEALLPIDFMIGGEISDDEIFRLLIIPLPKNVVVTALFDCCHSGTILDLPFEYSVEKPLCDYDLVKFPHMPVVEEYRNRMARVKKAQDLQDTTSVIQHSRSPVKHKPRGRPTTPRQALRRVSRSMEPSINKCKTIEEETVTTKVPEPRISRFSQQKQTSMQDNDCHVPLSPQKIGVSTGKVDANLNEWKKVVSKPYADRFPSRTSTKKYGAVHKETNRNKPVKSNLSPGKPTKRNLHPKATSPELPVEMPYQRRKLKRRSKSQPPLLNYSTKSSGLASKSTSPQSLRKYFESSPNPQMKHPPKKKGNVPLFAQKNHSQPGDFSKAQQRRHAIMTEYTNDASRSPSPTKRRMLQGQSPYLSKGRPKTPKANYESPGSLKRGRHATTFVSPRSQTSPPKIIEIPLL
jgi:hypothetical protein